MIHVYAVRGDCTTPRVPSLLQSTRTAVVSTTNTTQTTAAEARATSFDAIHTKSAAMYVVGARLESPVLKYVNETAAAVTFFTEKKKVTLLTHVTRSLAVSRQPKTQRLQEKHIASGSLNLALETVSRCRTAAATIGVVLACTCPCLWSSSPILLPKKNSEICCFPRFGTSAHTHTRIPRIPPFA